MPKVKGRQKPARRAAAKPDGKKGRRAGGRKNRGPRASLGVGLNAFFGQLFAPVQKYTLAASAGAAVIVLFGAIVLWAGGYLGRLAQSAARASETASLAIGLELDRVTLRGARNIAHQDVLDALALELGGSILHVDLAAARIRIEELGWVRSASVSRLLPDTIHVSVREREPAAVWQIDFGLKLIDSSGAVIRSIGASEYAHLPMIVGAGAPEAAAAVLQALAAKPDLEAMTHALVRVGERRWNMRLRNGVDIKLPEADFADAIDALHVLHAAHGTLDQPIEYIDLRDPERVVIRKRGEPERSPD